MKLSDVLKPELVRVGLRSEEKEEVFEEMVQLFVDAGMIQDRDTALEAIFEREAKMSTGIARWLAIPHGKIEEAKGLMVALGTSAEGIDYDSLDGEPVHVILMVFAELGNPGPHIEALAEISRLFSVPGFTGKIRDAGSVDDVMALIKREE
ncbi:MAG: PTS sugar transporter subunit IIA [Lentisphaeria bacterium]|nr:PTS sugar transporter subunit IIA [Lentisphaeria bacterium]